MMNSFLHKMIYHL